MNHPYEIIVIRLCCCRARFFITRGLGLGAYLRLGTWPLLNVFAGPFVLEVGRM